MPPSEGLKMLVSTMMTGHDDGKRTDGLIEMATWDVSRAHLHGEARMWIYTYFPEGYELKGKLATLCRSIYRTRDPASIWRDMVRSVEGRFHEGGNCVRCIYFAVKTEISKDCAKETTAAWWHDGSSCKSLGMSWRNGLRLDRPGTLVFLQEMRRSRRS